MFAEMEIVKQKAVHGHTHGESAACRSSASAFIDGMAASTGRRAVFLQGSASDVKNGREITRVHHWGKDWNVAPSQVEKQGNDLCAMIDVDYYVDMPDKLARNFRPLVLYTMQPTQAAADRGEYKYTFNSNSEVDYTVSGGGHYVHRIWNWQGDSVSATRKFCGIPITRSIFSIERKRVDDDHQIILLTPLVKFYGVRAWLSYTRAECHALRRLEPVDRGFIRLLVSKEDGLMMSTAKVGGYLSANVNIAVDEAIASAAVTTSKLTHATVKSKMSRDDCLGSEILLEYHLLGAGIPERVDALAGVRSFQWVEKYQDFEPEKPSMVAFMRPLYDGAFVPDNCANNDARMVNERVLKLREEPNQLTPFVLRAMREFSALFKETVGGDLRPYDYDVVYERQNKPSQRRILESAEHGTAKQSTSVFMKTEAYGKVTDPRAISQINGCDKRDYSVYMYPVADRMKKLEWYAFGKKPRAIAERVALICESSTSHADNTDFARMDGRVNANARELERIVMLDLFHYEHHIELLRLMKSQTGLRARTKHGETYDTGDARASGSPETSAANSILNGFIAYLGFRMSKRIGRFMSPREAWNAMGIYGGDDGLTVDQDGKAAERAARIMGQVLTVERVKKGELGISFLARRYGPDVWWGDSNSCCDIKRQSSKFHVTAHLSSKVTPQVKLKEKAFAFSLSDLHTPIIGWFVGRVLECYPISKRTYFNVLSIWNSDVAKADHYPNEQADWMFDIVTSEMPTFNVTGFLDWVATCEGPDLFQCPSFDKPADHGAKNGMFVVDEDIVDLTTTTQTTDTPASAAAAHRNTEARARRGAHARPAKARRTRRRL